jgi:hypothetical protein
MVAYLWGNGLEQAVGRLGQRVGDAIGCGEAT